ncbi:MAG: T9SS type A sorting domain-containing protein [Ignavibacterium sp.]
MYASDDTLYLVGHFTLVGNFSGGSGVLANRVARWDGVNWSAVGSGLSGVPEDLIVKDSFIYVVGNFSGANPPFEVIYKWDGLNWNLLATASGFFSEISFYDQENSFYCGGNFSTVSTIGAANNLVMFMDSSVITSIEISDNVDNPNDLFLFQNYPNPFNPSTKISWQSPVSSWQTLKVYDVLGNEVATLVNEEKPAGVYEINFDGSGLSSGIYFYRLKAGSFVETKKMILMR